MMGLCHPGKIPPPPPPKPGDSRGISASSWAEDISYGVEPSGSPLPEIPSLLTAESAGAKLPFVLNHLACFMGQ